MGKDETININPENVHYSKQRKRGGFGDIFGGFGGGLFDMFFGGLFGNMFGFEFEEEEEEYCDFTEADYRFINPKLRVIDVRKMIVLDKDDLRKLNPEL